MISTASGQRDVTLSLDDNTPAVVRYVGPRRAVVLHPNGAKHENARATIIRLRRRSFTEITVANISTDPKASTRLAMVHGAWCVVVDNNNRRAA